MTLMAVVCAISFLNYLYMHDIWKSNKVGLLVYDNVDVNHFLALCERFYVGLLGSLAARELSKATSVHFHIYTIQNLFRSLSLTPYPKSISILSLAPHDFQVLLSSIRYMDWFITVPLQIMQFWIVTYIVNPDVRADLDSEFLLCYK